MLPGLAPPGQRLSRSLIKKVKIVLVESTGHDRVLLGNFHSLCKIALQVVDFSGINPRATSGETYSCGSFRTELFQSRRHQTSGDRHYRCI
jgi:hypothetical protein